jgi:hypothetical protein
MMLYEIANSDKPVAFYSLDVIISVGYRVNSIRATAFRQWATSVLKQYMLKGYVVVIECRTDEIPGHAGDDMTVIQTTTRRHARLDRASHKTITLRKRFVLLRRVLFVCEPLGLLTCCELR